MSAEPILAASELEAIFGSGLGVGPASFTVAPGEEVLVLGPSGSGKSTLLRLLHGAVPHAIHARVRGAVKVAGRDVAAAQVAGLADVVGVVGQDPTAGVCLPEVDDELALPLENLCVDPSEIPGRVREALATVDAAHLAGRQTEELSGGELQRIALAAATVTRPRLLLLDEPTSMLDAAGIDGVRRAVAEVRRSTGAAVVLVEHRLDEYAGDAGLAGLPQRWIVVDRAGRIRFDGAAATLSDAEIRELLAAGCWLPAELEDRALGEPPEPVLPGTRPVAAAGPPLEARGLAVAPGGARRGGEGRAVLSGVDLTLSPGEVVALVGANGQGKSTLLTCLAGLHRPLAGTVAGPRAGLVFQNPEDQFQASTVRAEVAFGLSEAKHGRVEQWLTRFDLADLAEANPHQLSGGQKRRLSLAAMLVHEHPFLLADEPCFGLDRHATTAVLQALREVADVGRGVLFSSHDLRSVAAVADRVIVVGEGRVLADTTPWRLLLDGDLLRRAQLRPSARLTALAAGCDGDAGLRARIRAADARVTALEAVAA